MILGTFAYCGSGQDTLADGFCKYFSFSKYSIGDIIRDIAEKNELNKERKTLRSIRIDYDKIYGKNYFPTLLAKSIKDDSPPNAIITGIRTLEEFQIFHELLGMKLIFVYADEDIRFERMLKRNDEKDEKTYTALRQQMEAEINYFDYKKLENLASLTFNFNMPLCKYLKDEQKIIELLIGEIGE